eukprot:s332_g18.t2
MRMYDDGNSESAPVDLLDTTLLRGRAESQSYDVDGEVDAVDLEPVSEPPTQTEDADEVASLNSSEEADVQSPKASALRPPSGLATRATQRRFGVTAQSSSGWNVSWTAPEESKTAEQSAALRAALRQCPFMKKIDDDTLESLVRAMPVQTFDPGAIVCRQGARDDCAYVIVEGSVNVFQEPDPETDPDGAQVFVRPLTRGRLFGEFSMLWSTPRTRSVYVDQQQAVLGVLTQEVFRNLVVRNEMKERSRREACLRRSAMLETLDDEEIAQLADALQKKCFEEGEVIVRQGDTGNELYVVLEGTCVVTVETGSKDRDRDIQECKRCYAGDMFGEKALLEKTKRCATVSAATKVEVLALRRDSFERMLGPLSQLQKIHYLCDPRRSIADFYLPGDQSGPAGVCKERRTGEEPDATTWFAVYRPTSRDAIAKMLSGAAVGKGLNVKGKSAKMPNRLSGFVPFLQISQESHKSEIETSPADARVCIYFASEMLRQSAMVQLQALLETSSPIEEPEIRLLDHYESVPGLDVPEAVVQQAFILKPDIQPAVGWETGRVSEPAFMDMNLQALRGTSRPKVVLYQFDQDNPMNPHGLLIAYAENTVKPVVSDFDTFLVGSRGMDYEHLPPEQAELCLWALDHTEKILRSPSTSSWTSRWLEVLKEAHEKGFHPHIPEFGFGVDLATSQAWSAVQRTKWVERFESSPGDEETAFRRGAGPRFATTDSTCQRNLKATGAYVEQLFAKNRAVQSPRLAVFGASCSATHIQTGFAAAAQSTVRSGQPGWAAFAVKSLDLEGLVSKVLVVCLAEEFRNCLVPWQEEGLDDQRLWQEVPARLRKGRVRQWAAFLLGDVLVALELQDRKGKDLFLTNEDWLDQNGEARINGGLMLAKNTQFTQNLFQDTFDAHVAGYKLLKKARIGTPVIRCTRRLVNPHFSVDREGSSSGNDVMLKAVSEIVKRLQEHCNEQICLNDLYYGDTQHFTSKVIMASGKKYNRGAERGRVEDATSYRLIEEVIHTTKESGAIRHGAECFNFYFPQELDTNFLVVWEGFHDIDGKPWAYMDEDELRDFLTERVEENYALPLNPIWCVRDLGWFDILEHQIENQSCKAALEAWYPEQSGILEKIKALHEEFTEGLELKASADNARPLLRTLSHCPDLDMSEKAMLAISQASSAGSRWTTARLKVNVLQQIKRSSMAVHHLLGK